ncbi:cold shock domain-containing protein [Streptomyces sp. NPDC090057]|uniref:cold shock domain-containing protein n=1 Tax=Streptomyces sp. NPDC090057 TaxID=3365935 RepID=UPI00381C9E7C
MVAGRVVRFDGPRGCGFIAPEDGTEDVFLHVGDLLVAEQQLRGPDRRWSSRSRRASGV